MSRSIPALLFAAIMLFAACSPVDSACCYFAAKDKDILQPAQKAFITWDPKEKVETFTVQPKFEGNADDFGMVVPTPSKPKLDEMPRDFFRHLAYFTILEPMDLSKYKTISAALRTFGGSRNAKPDEKSAASRSSKWARSATWSSRSSSPRRRTACTSG